MKANFYSQKIEDRFFIQFQFPRCINKSSTNTLAQPKHLHLHSPFLLWETNQSLKAIVFLKISKAELYLIVWPSKVGLFLQFCHSIFVCFFKSSPFLYLLKITSSFDAVRMNWPIIDNLPINCMRSVFFFQVTIAKQLNFWIYLHTCIICTHTHAYIIKSLANQLPWGYLL